VARVGRSDGHALGRDLAEPGDEPDRDGGSAQRDLRGVRIAHAAPREPRLQNDQQRQVGREDRAVEVRVGHQEQQESHPRQARFAARIERTEREREQELEPVAPADDRVLVEQVVTEAEQKAVPDRKRRVAQDQADGTASDRQVQKLHRDRIARQTRYRVDQQIPERRMTLRSHVVEQVAQGVAVARDEPDLQLVAPHFVVQDAEQPQRGEQRQRRG